MASGISSVVEDKGTTSPTFRAAVDNIKKMRYAYTQTKKKARQYQKKRRIVLKKKYVDPERQFARSFDYGMGNKIVGKAAEWIMKSNMSPKEQQRMKARIEHFRK